MSPIITSARAVAVGLALAASTASANEAVSVCYNYGCAQRAEVVLERAALVRVQTLLEGPTSAREERAAVAMAVGWLYAFAGRSTPIWRDRGGNFADDIEHDGRMDCIDHSTNTTAFMTLMERRGWLRFHRVGARLQRGWFFSVHWGATLETRSGQRYVVDSWFHDPGIPAATFTAEAWLAGGRPANAATSAADALGRAALR